MMGLPVVCPCGRRHSVDVDMGLLMQRIDGLERRLNEVEETADAIREIGMRPPPLGAAT